MKKKTILFIAGFVTIGIVFAIGYTSGFIHGFRNAYFFDAPAKGVVDIVELRQLRRGDIKQVIESKEDHLDNQILLHSEYLKKGSPRKIQVYFSYFFEPKWNTAEKDYLSLMHTVVKYREEYPIHLTVPELTKDVDESYKKAVKSNVDNEIDLIKKTLIYYGWEEKP